MARTGATTRTGASSRVASREWGDKALKFDGANDYVSFGTSDFNFERTQAFSVSAWVNVEPFSGQPNGVIIGRANGSTTFRGWWIRYLNSSKTFEVVLANDFAGSSNLINVRTSNNAMPIKQWVHIGFSYDGSSTAAGITLYINGSSVSKTTAADNLAATIVDAGVTARMGTITDSTQDYNGSITDVAVYTDVLTAQEFSNIHFHGIYPSDNLYAQWKFTDGSGSTLTDSSGNSRNGTITAALWALKYAPIKPKRLVVRNYSNSVLTGGGSSDRIDLPDLGICENQSAWAASFWFRINGGVGTSSNFEIALSEGDAAAGLQNWEVYISDGFTATGAQYIRWRLQDITNTTVNVSAEVTLPGWHMITAINRTSTSRELYIDGELVKSDTSTVAFTAVSATTIGAVKNAGAYTQNGVAYMNDVMFWRGYAPTASEIAALYYSNVLPSTSPYARYLLTEGSGTSVADSAGGQASGTLAGTVTWTTDTPFKTRTAVS